MISCNTEINVITDLGTAGENVKRVKLYSFLRKHATGVATTELHIVHVERGMSWDEAMEKFSKLDGSKEGFWLSHQVSNFKILCYKYVFRNYYIFILFIEKVIYTDLKIHQFKL